MIELKNISLTFNKGTPLKNQLFKNFNLKIFPQDFVTVIGGNGSGKSTLLNLIAGNLSPDNGTILFDNLDITQQPTYKRASIVSRVFQDPLLGSYNDLTLLENLSLAFFRGQKRGLKLALSTAQKVFFQEKLRDIGFGLENRLSDKMGSLSGGQRQAISLMMATLQPSSILLLDEHTAALDPKMADSILALTQKIIEEKKLTVLMVTHSMSQTLNFGNRTLLIHHGKIIKDLKINERQRLTSEDLVALF